MKMEMVLMMVMITLKLLMLSVKFMLVTLHTEFVAKFEVACEQDL